MSIPGVPPLEPEPEAPAEAEEFQFGTLPPEIQYAVQGVMPPGALYIARDDELVINLINSNAGAYAVINVRMLRPDGVIIPMQFQATPGSNRNSYAFRYRLNEGFLLAVTVNAISAGYTLRYGHMWARGAIWRIGGIRPFYQILFSGYIDEIRPIGWPGGPQEPTVGGPGLLRFITGTAPAVGVDICETVPTGARWRLLCLAVVYVTSAAAGNRYPQLILDDGANLFWVSDPGAAVPASTGINVCVAAGGELTGPVLNTHSFQCPANAVLLQGYRIRIGTVNMDPGDYWTAPRLLVEEWLEL